MYTCPIKCLCGFTDFGAANTCPLSTWFLSIPRNKIPTLSPAIPSSNSLRNISIPVATVFSVSRKPMISNGSPTCTLPRSILPVATVPRPVMENTSSTAIKNGFSVSRCGSGIQESNASISLLMHGSPSSLWSPSIAFNAEPRTIGVLSRSKSYLPNKSRISSSTSSNKSASSIKSTLFKNTTNFGTFTCLAKSTCSRVCGIGPSTADTTKIAPSICAAPVIMFLI